MKRLSEANKKPVDSNPDAAKNGEEGETRLPRRVKGSLGSLLLKLAARRAELDPNEDAEDAPAVVEDVEGDKSGEDPNGDAADDTDATFRPALRSRKPLSLSKQLLVDFEDEKEDDEDDEDYVPEPGALDQTGAPANPFIAALTSGLKRKAHAFGAPDDSDSEEVEEEEEEESSEASSDSTGAQDDEDDIDPCQRAVNEEHLTNAEELRALQREAVLPIEELGVLYATEASASEACCTSGSSTSGCSAGSSSSSLSLTSQSSSHPNAVSDADGKLEQDAKAEADAKPELDAKTEPESKAEPSEQSMTIGSAASANERPVFKKVKPRNKQRADKRKFNAFMRLAQLEQEAAAGEEDAVADANAELDALEGSSSDDTDEDEEAGEREEGEGEALAQLLGKHQNAGRRGQLPKSSPPLSKRPCPVLLGKSKSKAKGQAGTRRRKADRKGKSLRSVLGSSAATDRLQQKHFAADELEEDQLYAEDDDDEDDEEMFFGFGPDSDVVRAEFTINWVHVIASNRCRSSDVLIAHNPKRLF